MANWKKALIGAAALGGAVVAGAVYYVKKKNSCEDEDFENDFEDEDFDLDDDLKPVEREYVSLTPSSDNESDTEACEDDDAEACKDESTECCCDAEACEESEKADHES
ncbi:MAG: hypothetical protein ACI4UH_05730 [Dorea sp.]